MSRRPAPCGLGAHRGSVVELSLEAEEAARLAQDFAEVGQCFFGEQPKAEEITFRKLVNISTGLQNMIREGAAAYGHSKAALEAMTATWSHDLKGSGVTANCLVCPFGACPTQ